MLETLRDAALDALALALPVECAGCGAPDRALCPRCRRALAPDPALRELDDGLLVASGLGYDGPPGRVLLAAKESGRTDVLGALAPALAAAVRARAAALADPAGVVVALVPCSRASWRRRGYDPVRMLAGRAGLAARRLLRATGASVAQKTLGSGERAANRAGTVAARRRLDGIRVLLVDDVVTTGATLQEAARAVRAAGGEVVGAAAALSVARHRAVVGEP